MLNSNLKIIIFDFMTIFFDYGIIKYIFSGGCSFISASSGVSVSSGTRRPRGCTVRTPAANRILAYGAAIQPGLLRYERLTRGLGKKKIITQHLYSYIVYVCVHVPTRCIKKILKTKASGCLRCLTRYTIF